MNTNRILVACAAWMVAGASAFAWSGPLSVPTFTSPTNCPQAVSDQGSAALNRRDAKFVEGRFFGFQQHSMIYRGDTKALNGMLADLAACPRMLLTVAFVTNLTADADWSVGSQLSPSNFLFRVAVNTSSARVKLPEMVMPAVQGAVTPKEPPRFTPPHSDRAGAAAGEGMASIQSPHHLLQRPD